MTDPMLRASTYDPTYNRMLGSIEPYRGTDHTVRRMRELARGPRGERSILVRRHAEQIISNVRPKDYCSEVIAVAKWWTTAGRYTRDPVHVELLKDPQRLVEDAQQGRLVADCDDITIAIIASCLCIGAECEILTVGFKPQRWGAPKEHTHVLARAQDPRTKIWWILDPVAGRRTDQMLRRVKQHTRFAV